MNSGRIHQIGAVIGVLAATLGGPVPISVSLHLSNAPPNNAAVFGLTVLTACTPFDLSLFDLFAAWDVGACLCCPTPQQRALRVAAAGEVAVQAIAHEDMVRTIVKAAATTRGEAAGGGGTAWQDRRTGLGHRQARRVCRMRAGSASAMSRILLVDHGRRWQADPGIAQHRNDHAVS